MNFKSVNELDTFSFKDCQLSDIIINDNSIRLLVEALIIKGNNSQNSNYTDSYAGPTEITLKLSDSNAGNNIISQLITVTKLGYKKYDANDKLIDEVADSIIPFAVTDIKKLIANAYLPEINKTACGYSLIIEVPDEDPYAVSEEYCITLEALEPLDGAADTTSIANNDPIDMIVEWDKYLNRVQNY